jgi:hypothetical protein
LKNDIPQDVQVLNYNVELRPASLELIRIFILLTLKIYGQRLVGILHLVGVTIMIIYQKEEAIKEIIITFNPF